jgi:GNAT superfamily N-acetyltransferase
MDEDSQVCHPDTVRFIEKSEDLEAAFILLSELNQVSVPVTRERFALGQAEGLKMVGVFCTSGECRVAGVATFRFCWRLYCGRTLYIDDFITASAVRLKGYGSILFQWLADHARAEDCINVTLDTGVRVFGAHRFYHLHGMKITSHHMTLNLNGAADHPHPIG